MDEKAILQVLLDQKEELEQRNFDQLCSRKEELLFEWESNLAQVVIGVRRSGKSTLCHKVLNELGVKYGYVDFDDDRLAKMQIEDLNTLLSCIFQIYGTDVKYLFMDEVQNVDGWYLFVNRLLRQSLHIVLTGSNAKLLSGELATHMTGRYNEIRLFPFSYQEYCTYLGVNLQNLSTRADADRKIALNNYLVDGGLPELIRMKQSRNKRIYIDGLLETILTKDIAARYKIRHTEGLKWVMNHLINNDCQVINYGQMLNLCGTKSINTVRKYVDYLSQAFLIQKIQKFSYKSKERIGQEKVYLVDTGLVAHRENALVGENIGWKLENIVYIELRRRYVSHADDVYYYKPNARGKEIDFVICRQGNVIELVQVCYSLTDSATAKREMDALIQGAMAMKCDNLTILTLDASSNIDYHGEKIHVINIIEWLLTMHDARLTVDGQRPNAQLSLS